MENINKLNKIYELVKSLNLASDSYYNGTTEIMSDKEYDRLYDELSRLEHETGYIMASSPTQKVGFEVKDELEKVRHETPLLSLDKIQNDMSRVEKFISKGDCVFMLKGDGLTTKITYINGELTYGSTRGDGDIGSDISHNIKTYKNIPKTINFKGTLEVTGESVILLDDYNFINSKIENPKDRFSNQRSMASGSVKQLNSEIASKRNIMFLTFGLLKAIDENGNAIVFETVMQQFEFLSKLGFYIIPHVFVKKDFDELENVMEALKQHAENEGFPIDGIVIKYNDIEYGNSLGRTIKFPLNAIAFKFEDEVFETKYIQTEWNTSRTGQINPTALFESVEIDGTDVESATLHNVSFFNGLEFGKGDNIYVYKANQIIPKIKDNLTRSNTEEIPKKCKVCGCDTEIRTLKTADVLYCTNEDCIARKISQFTHFVSKSAINIDGLSEATLEKFVNKGFIKSFVDIFKLEQYKKEIISMKGFGLKSYNNLIKSIEKAKKVKLSNFLFSLGIKEIGSGTSKLICKHLGNSLDCIQMACVEDFEKIDGIGHVTAKSLSEWMRNENNKILINEILEFVEFEVEEINNNAENKLEGMTFVITGDVHLFKNRDELKAKIEQLGGKVTGSVSKKTNYLINNDVESTTGKNKKAKELDVKIINEEDFMKMI